jgi:nucleoporin NUP82
VSPSDRWSFDSPTTSIDLKKLADGMSLEQDFSASTTATNKGFSPDLFDMEIASASFPGKGSGGWNPMTLWLAMRGGDVYALCPLLPQRWAPPPTLIPSLSVSIVTTVASIEDDPEITEHEKLLAQQQLEWMGDLDAQEPLVTEGPPGEAYIEIYNRPSRPGIVPRLQGPFELDTDPETGDDLDTSITDILVIGKKTETDELMMGEETELDMDEGDQEGLSLTVVCLLSTSGQIRIYLDLEGVQAQWLPPKNKSRLSRLLADSNPGSLLAFQALDSMSPVEVSEDSWPVFSRDVMSRYSFFVTHHAGIVHISLTSWIFRLESELNGDSEAGTDFRVGLLVNSQSTRDRIYSQPTADTAQPLSAAVALRDPDVGYFLLSCSPFEPIALTFETPEDDLAPIKQEDPVYEREASVAPLEFYEPRPVFRPSHAFDQPSALPLLLDRWRTSRHKAIANQEVRLSPLTLSIFTDAHKVLSDETYRLGVAAAALFRRCELLQNELRVQVDKANQVRNKVDAINGAHRDGEADQAMYERRISEAKERQEKLAARVESLRMIVGKATTRDLSVKEKAFAEEVRSVEASISRPSGEAEDEAPSPAAQLWKRLEDARNLQAELVAEVDTLKEGGEAEATSGSQLRIPPEVRRNKLQQVQGLLSRETALVEAVTARLERLQTSV